MSPAATAAAPAPAYESLARCASICRCLDLLSGPTLREACLEVLAVSRGGFGKESYALPVAPTGEFVPQPILRLLEEGGSDWAAFAYLAARERGAVSRPIRMNAMMVAETLPLAEGEERRLVLPVDAINRTISRVCSFVLAPSAIVVGGARIQGAGIVVAALYGLTNPIDLRSELAQRDALDLMRKLAFAVAVDGIAADVAIGDLLVPLPGFGIRELPPHHEIESALLWSDRRYALDDIRNALQES